jgi:glycosyltransferase involved in cell wall biosynthesis
MPANETSTLDRLGVELRRLRGDPAALPDASVVIPVNAQEDLTNVLGILGDIARYKGTATLEVVLVINNYPEDDPPPELETYARAGVRTVGVPNARRPGEVVSFTARVPGAREASSEVTIYFDADCRVPNPSALLTWYVERLRGGARAAYSPVAYYDLRSLWSVRARIAVHHAARWAKRVALRIPTVRGSNYAVDRKLFLRLYDEGKLIDDLNVGLAVKASGGSLAYSGDRELRVLTSGRRFKGGWLKLARYLFYRMRYNLRMITSSKRGAQKPGATYDRTPSR